MMCIQVLDVMGAYSASMAVHPFSLMHSAHDETVADVHVEPAFVASGLIYRIFDCSFDKLIFNSVHYRIFV